jgi:DivIVA domain-containing protein
MSSASTSASSTTSTSSASSSFSNPSASNSAVKNRSSAVDDLRNAKFTSAFRGYDPAEVRAFLQRMATRVEAELGLSERVVLTPIAPDSAPDVELVLDEAAYLAATEAAASALDAGPVQSADDVLLAARSEYEAILASARNEANAIVVKANDDAARIILRARAESRGKPSADSSAVVEAAYAQAASDPELAREQARLMITEARAVRERILTDLNKRRRVAHVQLEQLRVAREKLTETLREARRIVDDSARDLSTAEVEARLAADAAGRRISAEALPSIGELEVELWGGRHMPSTRTFASPSTPVSDADDSFEQSGAASTPTPVAVSQGEVLGASNVEAAPLEVGAVALAVAEVAAAADVTVEGAVQGVVVDGVAVVEDVAEAEGVGEAEAVPAIAVALTDVSGAADSAVVVESGPDQAEVVAAEVTEVQAEAEASRTGLVLSVPMLVDTESVAEGETDAMAEAEQTISLLDDSSTPRGLPVVVAEGKDAPAQVATSVSMNDADLRPDSGQVLRSHDLAESAASSEPVEVAKKRPANVDDLFARLRADRERAAVEARSVLGVKEADEGTKSSESSDSEEIKGAVLDLRPNDGGSGSGNRGSNGSQGGGSSKRSKGSSGSPSNSSGSSAKSNAGSNVGSPTPLRIADNASDSASHAAVAQAGAVAVLDRSDVDDQVTAIVLDLRPNSSASELRSAPAESVDANPAHSVSEADDGMDFVVGPLHSSLIRTVKRRLHDEQSSILAMLRSYRGTLDVDRLLGSVQEHQLRLTAEIHPIFVDAFRVGAEKSGAHMTDAEIDDLLREHIESVAASVTASIRSEVASIVAEQGGNDSRALGESLTSTYRTWTTERIGTVVTGAVVETYRLGTAA